MNIVIPMAGRGSRLSGHESGMPKPLIQVNGHALYEWAASCLPLGTASRLVFVCRREHQDQYQLRDRLLQRYAHLPVEVVLLDSDTDGQLRTVMRAADVLLKDKPLMIFNADTWFYQDTVQFFKKASECDGVIGVAQKDGSQWSFVRLDRLQRAVEVAEKQRISNLACTGLYYFADTSRFIDDASEVFCHESPINGEYFVAPLYQLMIDRGDFISVCTADEFYPIGTREELAAFTQRIGTASLRD